MRLLIHLILCNYLAWGFDLLSALFINTVMNMEVAGMSYLQMLSIGERKDTSWMSIGSETFQVE